MVLRLSDVIRRMSKNHNRTLPYSVVLGDNILVERPLLYSNSSRVTEFSIESRRRLQDVVERSIEWCRENYGPAATDTVERVVRGRKKVGYPETPHWLFVTQNNGRVRFSFDTEERATLFKVFNA
jgi:hypothetical protein